MGWTANEPRGDGDEIASWLPEVADILKDK